MKKFIKLFCCMIALFLFMISETKVEAAHIVIERDDNPSGVVVYSLETEQYYIEIDEELSKAYIWEINNGHEEFLGSCSVIIYDSHNNIKVYSCDENSLGEVIIYMTNDDEGCIVNSVGLVSQIYSENTTIRIIN